MQVISVVGWHNSGKTSFVTDLVSALKARGLRIAVVKHSRGDYEIDHRGTDTWRFSEAGADISAIVGRGGLAYTERFEAEPDLQDVLERLGPGVDLVITEGFKNAPTRKFEVRHQGITDGRIVSRPELLALVSDDAHEARLGERHVLIGDIQAALVVLREEGMLD